MTKREKIIDLIQEMDTSEQVYLHNEYCYATNNYDDEIFTIDQLDELCSGQDAFWVACRCFYGDFKPSAEYIKFNGYGNFQSIYQFEIPDYIDENEIATYILDNDIDFENSDIRYILDDIEEEPEQ